MCHVGKVFPINTHLLNRYRALFPRTRGIVERERWKVDGVDILRVEFTDEQEVLSPHVLICPCDIVSSLPRMDCPAREKVCAQRKKEVRDSYLASRALIPIEEMILDAVMRVQEGAFFGQTREYGSDVLSLSSLREIIPFSMSDIKTALVRLEMAQKIQIVPHLEDDPLITLGGHTEPHY